MAPKLAEKVCPRIQEGDQIKFAGTLVFFHLKLTVCMILQAERDAVVQGI